MKSKLTMKYLIIALISISIFSCGKTSVSVDERTYEPKIVFNAYIYPEQPVADIRISRNFAIGQEIERSKIALSDANVTLTNLSTGDIYTLAFNNGKESFEYRGDDLDIAYGTSYRLTASAEIDGVSLQASSVTDVPDKGLEIDLEESIYGDLFYRQTGENGQLISPRINYKQSDNSAFFLVSITSLQASEESFIYENPFGFEIQEALDDGAKIEDFQYSARWTRPENQIDGISAIELTWFQFWFYGEYRLILYAGDQNFFHFYNTHASVQEPDGNLHEPLFHIDGDGIGVFGSAVTDTVYINVLKK
jgi:hypothetical protein